MTTSASEVEAIRTSVGVSRLDHVSILRLAGDGAWDVLDRAYTRDLHIRDGQIGHGLLLSADGTVFADTYLGCDDDELFLLVEGPDTTALRAHLEAVTEGADEVEATDVSATQTIVGIDGPYAWELMSLLIGPEVIGLPYLTFFRADGLLCYRAGKTGEFGYRLVTAREQADALVARLLELGEALSACAVARPALEQCALENWFFNIRREGARAVTPIELQLQWRLSNRKGFVGSPSLALRREEGIRTRLTALSGPEPFEVDDVVRYADEEIGVVVNAGYAPSRSDWVGMALLDLAYAWPGVEPLRVGEASAPAATQSPPFLRNRSLYVNPQIHAWATRADDDFPPIHGA